MRLRDFLKNRYIKKREKEKIINEPLQQRKEQRRKKRKWKNQKKMKGLSVIFLVIGGVLTLQHHGEMMAEKGTIIISITTLKQFSFMII